jgi:hypothetical protein
MTIEFSQNADLDADYRDFDALLSHWKLIEAFSEQVLTRHGFPTDLRDDLTSRFERMQTEPATFGGTYIYLENNTVCIVKTHDGTGVVEALYPSFIKFIGESEFGENPSTHSMRTRLDSFKSKGCLAWPVDKLILTLMKREGKKQWEELVQSGQGQQVYDYLYNENAKESKYDIYRCNPYLAIADWLSWGYPSELATN